MKFYTLSALAGAAMAQNTQVIDLLDSALAMTNFNGVAPARVTDHGCWCSKLDSTVDDSLLGGPKAYDALDEICKNYFKKRACITRLSGGSCENDDLSGSYTVDVSGANPQCLGSGCAADLCKIDAEFLDAANTYVQNEIINGGLKNATVVDAVGVCELPTKVGGPKECQGTSPDVRAVSTGPVVAASSAQAVNLCENEVMDLILLVDGSGSMGTSGYSLAVDFTQEIVDILDIDSDATRVSIVQFASSVRTYCTFADTVSAVNGCITSMRNSFMRGGTYTNRALNSMVSHFSNGRSNAKKVFMILTDGYSSDGVSASGNMRNIATSFGIGIGSGAPVGQINQIATDPDSDHVYLVSNFNNLDSIKLGIISAMCQT